MGRRATLLPPYLAVNPAWKELVDALDEVFEGEVDLPTELLARIRDNWIISDDAVDKIDAAEILSSSDDFFAFERETLIRQANMIGFLFKETDLMSDEDYRRIVRNLGHYWFSKGTPEFIDLLAFCLDTTIKVIKLWSLPGPSYETYGDMREEGDPAIGTPNHQGGQWFETSHVNLIVDPMRFATAMVPKLVALFNALANYNLVLNTIVFEFTAFIHSPGDEIAVITKAYPVIDITQVIYTAGEVPEGFLLQENGYRILQENGDFLLLG
jgi:hypothetical protein